MSLRAATWNLRVGRPPHVVANEVETFLDDHNLDVLCVQEAAQYVGALRRRLRGEFRVLHGRGSRSRRDSAVIVRKGARVRRKRVHRLGGIAWERGKGRPGLHDPRHMTSVNVCGVRFGSVHLPPTPHARTLRLRRLSHAADVDRLVRIVRRWTRQGAWVAAGDWNARPSSQYVAPLRGLGLPYGDGIDWVLASGVTVSDFERQTFGSSDHKPRTFNVRS